MEGELGIPKSFKIFAQTITVIWDEELTNVDDAIGQARFRYNTIALQPSMAGKPLTSEQIIQSFWHEVFHFILHKLGGYKIGDTRLSSDERLVDLLGSALHQVLASAEGELEIGL